MASILSIGKSQQTAATILAAGFAGTAGTLPDLTMPCRYHFLRADGIASEF
jgi:hypothetical protein